MDQLLMLIVGGIYILIFGFMLLIIVRAYQALTIYVIKNAHYLPSGIFIRRRDFHFEDMTISDDQNQAETDAIKQKES